MSHAEALGICRGKSGRRRIPEQVQRKWVPCLRNWVSSCGQREVGGKRHHDDVCGTPVTWVTTCRWVNAEQKKGRCRRHEARIHEGWNQGWEWNQKAGTAAYEGLEGLGN